MTTIRCAITIGGIKSRSVSDSLSIAASPEVIFAVLANPARHEAFNGSGPANNRGELPHRLVLGSRFAREMTLGPIKYSISRTVIEFEENRLIAWAHRGMHVRRYELEPAGRATMVTETFEWPPSLFPPGIGFFGYPRPHNVCIAEALKRLAALVVDQTTFSGHSEHTP